MVEDQYGRDPALRVPGTTILLFPLTTISKRIETGQAVDIFNLYYKAVTKVKELQKRGM